MPQKSVTLHEALAGFDRPAAEANITVAEQERQEILQRFPLGGWPSMTLEQYALGTEQYKDSFCYWMEWGGHHICSMQGGSARKHIIYQRGDGSGWYYDEKTYSSAQEAWNAVRDGFVAALDHAKAGDWDAIDDIVAISSGAALRTKALHVYFPNDVLPITSGEHIRHFLRLLQRAEAEERNWGTVRLNRALLIALREKPEFDGWSTQLMAELLYAWSDPRETRRVIKIAPGENARFWQDCISGGYICVGWDEVGDLRAFDSKETFRAAFHETFAELHKHHKPKLTAKANELWTLVELEPGDVIIANHGISRILAVGEVVSPGYEWRPERPEFKHTVHVKWDTSYEQDIEPQKRWAFAPVARVPMTLYSKIAAQKGGDPKPVSVEPVFSEIADALERKGQVILYGPPGTGKTYTARRFAVWWLLRELKQGSAETALTDAVAFSAAERGLSTAQAAGRTWWIVANPGEWSWDTLFDEKRVDYRYGRLKRNYPLVQQGDLVVGYQATPDLRIRALARVTAPLHVTAEGERKITLEPEMRVEGPSYAELAADPIMSKSEPLRFRNQGTLFALTREEADHVLSLLAERQPDVQSVADPGGGVGHLTLLTFHASYSYEDFIEGFRPVQGASETLVLRLEDGVFKRVCREAQANPGKPYLVLVDEINRGNVAKVLGELVTLLEQDKRGVIVTLPQSKEPFAIPPNVYVLATMNTADRSIKQLDSALRRRFAFLELMPDLELLHGARVGNLALDDFLDELNRRVARKEGREKQIGHSYLLDGDEPVSDPAEFARRFRQEILPLLQEYCYDEYSSLAEYIGEELVDREAQLLDVEKLSDPDQLLDALEREFKQAGSEA